MLACTVSWEAEIVPSSAGGGRGAGIKPGVLVVQTSARRICRTARRSSASTPTTASTSVKFQFVGQYVLVYPPAPVPDGPSHRRQAMDGGPAMERSDSELLLHVRPRAWRPHPSRATLAGRAAKRGPARLDRLNRTAERVSRSRRPRLEARRARRKSARGGRSRSGRSTASRTRSRISSPPPASDDLRLRWFADHCQPRTASSPSGSPDRRRAPRQDQHAASPATRTRATTSRGRRAGIPESRPTSGGRRAAPAAPWPRGLVSRPRIRRRRLGPHPPPRSAACSGSSRPSVACPGTRPPTTGRRGRTTGPLARTVRDARALCSR